MIATRHGSEPARAKLMDVWALASGSSGNCFLIASEGTRLLVECGRPLQQVLAYLDHCGVQPHELDGIVLTHAHGDHVRSARELSDLGNVPVYASTGTLGCSSLRDSPLGRPLTAGRAITIGEVDVVPFAVPHDCVEPLGFRFESASARIVISTDLGWVPESVQAQLTGLDLLVFEANYDPMMLETGPYPGFLKRRVGGSRGHLSNQAAAHAIAGCGDRAPRAVWLAHLSEKNNTQGDALATVARTLRTRGLGHVPLHAARHRRPSLRWSSFAPEPREAPAHSEQLPLPGLLSSPA